MKKRQQQEIKKRMTLQREVCERKKKKGFLCIAEKIISFYFYSGISRSHRFFSTKAVKREEE